MTQNAAIEPCSPASSKQNQTKESAGTVLLGWLRIFSRHYRHEMQMDDLPIYAEALSDLTAQQIDAACRSALKTSHFWPTVADIRAQLNEAAGKGFALEGEREWQKLLAWVRANVFPDTGIRRGAAKLTPAVEHAAKAAGGVFYLERCDENQLVWCRKTFLATYANVQEAGQVEHLLSDGAAKRILRELSVDPTKTPRQIAPAKECIAAKPSSEEVRAVLHKVTDAREEVPPISEEEWERRKARNKRALDAWMAAHPEISQPVEATR
jgi:hypothetical protein